MYYYYGLFFTLLTAGMRISGNLSQFTPPFSSWSRRNHTWVCHPPHSWLPPDVHWTSLTVQCNYSHEVPSHCAEAVCPLQGERKAPSGRRRGFSKRAAYPRVIIPFKGPFQGGIRNPTTHSAAIWPAQPKWKSWNNSGKGSQWTSPNSWRGYRCGLWWGEEMEAQAKTGSWGSLGCETDPPRSRAQMSVNKGPHNAGFIQAGFCETPGYNLWVKAAGLAWDYSSEQ